MMRLSLAVLVCCVACGDESGDGAAQGDADSGTAGETLGGGDLGGAASGGDGTSGAAGGLAGGVGGSQGEGEGEAGDGDQGATGDAGGNALGPAVPRGYVRTCRSGCNDPADCPRLDPVGAHTQGHYACDDGACRYLGCRDDDECKISYTREYACRPPVTGGTPLQCTLPCMIDTDCGSEGRPHNDADNWSCVAGGCLYQGCLSNEECRLGRGDGWVCRATIGGTPKCFETCEEPSTCGGSDTLFDADNHVCDGGLCVLTGCIDDNDCDRYFGVEGMVCR